MTTRTADLSRLRERRWPPPPSMSADRAVTMALYSGTWTSGPYTHDVEEAMKELTGAPYAVAFQSCTAAIHATLLAHGVRAGTPLHTPAFGFAGTLTGAAHIGARLLYHDVDPDTGNSIDPLPAPGAVVLTPDLHGVPHTLPRDQVITDACQSLGTLVNGRHLGAAGTHCWSFSATKLVSAPDGGAVTTDNEDLADDLRQLRDYGAEPGHPRANALITRPGHNWRPTELSMAIAVDEIRFRLPLVAPRARDVGARLRETLADTGLWHQQVPAGTEPAFHKIRTGLPGTPPSRYRALRTALRDANVPTHDWGTIPLPAHPTFATGPGLGPHVPAAVTLADWTFCLGTEQCPPWTWTDEETDLVAHTLEMIMESL
ncbi:DegT/DnrJ/EryC1/StrS aminotransferase family protein [Streptomyces sp. 2P-4]|uniref:DegT/DnrJ/EryC1/StrS family aminotransferase n=1 Tax=Streptomyces sp. 2P-4 TaxID=2931974 RepID=UPI00253F9ABC|nr:DegT/DnrJ/EryC1/StrS aminotransferase family protein [Streptomyces sp. 2P-4]